MNFLITNTGHGREKVVRRKKVLNNINIMKHSQFSSLFQLSHHVSSDKMPRHLCFTAFMQGFPKGRFQGQWGFSFQLLLLLKNALEHNERYHNHPYVQTLNHKWLHLIHIHMVNYCILSDLTIRRVHFFKQYRLIGLIMPKTEYVERSTTQRPSRVQEATSQKGGQVCVIYTHQCAQLNMNAV